jgi:hypothetical protein
VAPPAAACATLSFFFVRLIRNTIQPMMAMTRRPRGTPTPAPTATGRLELLDSEEEEEEAEEEEEEVVADGGEEDVVLVDDAPVAVLVSPVVVMVVDPDVVLTPMTVTVVAAAVGGKDSWSAKWTLM